MDATRLRVVGDSPDAPASDPLADMEARISAAVAEELDRPTHRAEKMAETFKGYITRATDELQRRRKEAEIRVADLREHERAQTALREEEVRAIREAIARDRAEVDAAVAEEEARAAADVAALERNLAAARAFVLTSETFGRSES